MDHVVSALGAKPQLVLGTAGAASLSVVEVMPEIPGDPAACDHPDRGQSERCGGEGPLVADGWEVVGSRSCSWCSATFAVLARPGRPRLFCRRSCRQRAYERRAGLGVLPPVDRRVMAPNPVAPVTARTPIAYEGGFAPGVVRTHAMRPSGRPDQHGRWSTLCGVLARPLGRPYVAGRADACVSCARSEGLRPTARPLAPSATLAALRSVLEDAGVWVDRRDRWLKGTWKGDRLPASPDTYAEIFRIRDLAVRMIEAA